MEPEELAYPNTRLFIDGEWCGGSGGETLPVVDPATGEVIGSVALADRTDLDRALGSAERGFKAWSAIPAHRRARLLRDAATLLRERRNLVAWMLTREQGKPLAEAKAEVLLTAEAIEWFAEEARRTYGQTIPARTDGVAQMTLRLPVGPVAAFTPWNFPLNQSVRKVAAALAAGCSVVVKAAEETPASSAELVRVFQDVGLPAGAVNLVYGNPAEISEYLIPHPVIRKVSFTGSTPVGKSLAALAGQHMKRVTMELGGHAPVIVAQDADLSKAVKVLAASKFLNAGQVCISPTRFLVHDEIYEPFLDAFTAAAQAVKVGNGLDRDVQMGPLANQRRLDALEGLVCDAVERGAEVRAGGCRIGNKGYFFAPTVIANAPKEARLMNEEPFGPVAVVNPFATLDDAIAEANRLPFGLASYAFTQSAETAHVLARRVEAGMMSINHNGFSFPEVPFGGINDSGHGTEGGSEAIDAYLDTRFVTHQAF